MDKAITFKIPADKLEQVRQVSKTKGQAVASMIRQIVYEYLDQHAEK